MANLEFQQAIWLRQHGQLAAAHTRIREACRWMSFTRTYEEAPAEVWAISGEMHKFLADVTALAVEGGVLADLPEAESAPASWREALSYLEQYMRRSPERRHMQRVRAAALEITEYLSGKRKPELETGRKKMRERIREAREPPPPPGQRKHDHP